jgi:hypothetical protein
MSQINFNNSRETLTEADKDQIIALVTKGCRLKNTMRIRSILTYSALSLTHYGIFNRIIKEDGAWRYIAGQSYADEIKTVRELILKGK